MGKVKKSIKKFNAKLGPNAGKNLNRKRKAENVEKTKRKTKKDAEERRSSKAAAGAQDESDDEVTREVKELEAMDVGDFMDALGSDDEEDDEEAGGGGSDVDSDDDSSDGAGAGGGGDDEDDSGDEEAMTLKGSLSAHKADLAALADKDPDFYKFLQENNQELLEFAEDDDGEDDEEEGENEDTDGEDSEGRETGEVGGESEGSDAEDSEGEDEVSAPAASPGATVVNLAQIKTLVVTLGKEHSLRGLKRLVDMYRCGCAVSDPEAAAGKYAMGSAGAFDHLMVSALQLLHKEFKHHLVDPTNPERPANKSSLWGKLEAPLYSFFKATLGLMRSVTDMGLLAFVLKQLQRYCGALLVPFPKLCKAYLKAFLSLWGESQSPDKDARAVQVAAFFRVRQLSMTQPFPVAEDALKGLYLAYVRNSRFINEQSLPVVTFMGNCVVELCGVDLGVAFQHGFVYVRQLAMALRNAHVKKTKESLGALFNWQFLNCLRCWSAAVAAYPGEVGGDEQLGSLAYPLVQVLLGVDKLATSARLVPFRLHIARLLNQVAVSTGTFIPTAAVLLEVLKLPDLHKRPAPASDLPPRLEDVLRFPEATGLSTRHQQDAVFASALDLLAHTTDAYKFSPGFPEYAAPVSAALRKLAKEIKVGKWRTQAQGLAESLGTQAAWVSAQRAKLTVGPGSGGIESLLPKGKPGAKARHEARNAAAAAERAAVMASDAAAYPGKYKGPKDKTRASEAAAADEDSEGEAPAVDEGPKKKAKKKRKVKKREELGPAGELPEDGDEVKQGFAWDSDDE